MSSGKPGPIRVKPPPTVGRIVHYTDGERYRTPVVCAAIITAVHDGADRPVSLHVFSAGASQDLKLTHVAYTERQAGTDEASGCWTWPAREP